VGNYQQELKKARAYAFLLLKFRLRSEYELSERLKRKKFNQEIIRKTIVFLKEKKFLDDEFFARSWVNSRIKKPLGLRRLKQELMAKGIADQTIEEQLASIKNNYSEKEVVSGIIQERLSKLKRIEPQNAKRRTFAYLLRRGFSPGIVSECLNQPTGTSA